MRLSHIRIVRRTLVGLIVFVLLAVSFNYFQTWRRRGRLITQAAKILSADTLRSADRIEYSENEKGVVRFKIRAEELLEKREGKNLLRGIEAFDFNPDGSIRNHIRSRQAQYDSERKKAFFSGDVRIGMQRGMQLRTDSLSYDLDTNTGTTDDRLRIDSPEIFGTAKGIRYEHKQEILELQSEIDLTLKRRVVQSDGSTKEEPVRVTSAKAYYSGAVQTVRFMENARLESETDLLSGEEIEATLSTDRKNITSLLCRGNARYLSRETSEARAFQGNRIAFVIASATGALERIDVDGQAEFVSKTQEMEQALQGAEIHLDLDSQNALPRRVASRTAVQFSFKTSTSETRISGENLEAVFLPRTAVLDTLRVWDHAHLAASRGPDDDKDELRAEEIQIVFRDSEGRSVPRALKAQRSVEWQILPRKRKPQGALEAGRTLKAASLEMLYAENSEILESGSASGSVVLSLLPSVDSTTPEIRRLLADTVQFQFYPRDNRLRSFEGAGHIEVFYLKPANPATEAPSQEFHTSSNNIRATFHEKDGTTDTVSQWGNFRYEDRARTATAGKGDYKADSEVMILRDSPKISDASTSTSGEVMEYDQKKKILSVNRHVRTVLRSKEGETRGRSSNSGSPSVVTSDALQYRDEDSRARYSGNVQMLSESGQLQARVLEIVDNGEQMHALGDVRHLVLQNASSVKTTDERKSGPGALKLDKETRKGSQLRLRSEELRYNKQQNSVHYRGKVTLKSDDVWMSSESLDAVLDPEGKEIERAAARGDVLIRQNARAVKGDFADYYLLPGKFVVTGHPAEIFDPEKGKSQARRLTFFESNDSILLENQ